MMNIAYDIIGDIHGHSRSLEALLAGLGYRKEDGVFRHPDRQVIFLGDFIDRGKFQVEVIEIVRPMIDDGVALSVMGNHEFNAIAYYTPSITPDEYLREHSKKNSDQHEAFLDVYEDRPADYEDIINWFRKLPLWLDLGGLRVIHACWDAREIARIQEFEKGDRCLGDELLQLSSHKGTWQYQAVETILKGKEIPLQSGMSFRDKDGHLRHHIRVRWWDQQATTYREAYMGPDSALTHIPNDEIGGDHLIEYAPAEPPVFLGHYWMEGQPAPLAPNIACLDYSVAKPGGKLVAYRWDGEQTLSQDKFVWVERIEK